ncbi:MAG: YaaL family protein [Defluviitaleaceae bacterium]|nr:YaaL family protein [Defluviitaleaceae bacterium]
MSQPAIVTETTLKRNTKLKRKAKFISEEDGVIVKTLENLKHDLESARNCLDNITDPILIDSYIFEIASLNSRYQYYLKLCKDKGIVADI